MMLLTYILHTLLLLCCVVAQESTIPVGERGLDTLTTIRLFDEQGNYDVGYNENQLTGGASFYREKGFINGTREGSYGYTTRNGLIRIVTYVADKDGYRAEVLTNEPGISDQNPASVTVTKETEPDPAALAQDPATYVIPQQTSATSQTNVNSVVDSRSTPDPVPQGSAPVVPRAGLGSSSVVYATASADVVKNYVQNNGVQLGMRPSSAQVKVVLPYAQYQYVL